MSTLARETAIVQNAGLGAALLWRFAVGYVDASEQQLPAPLPVLFLALPLLLHEDSLATTDGTYKSSGLRMFVDKFRRSDIAKTDILLTLAERVQQLRPLTLESLRIALSSRLVSLDPESAQVAPLTRSLPPRSRIDGIRVLMRSADKIGTWCGRVSAYELALLLGLRL